MESRCYFTASKRISKYWFRRQMKYKYKQVCYLEIIAWNEKIIKIIFISAFKTFLPVHITFNFLLNL